MIDILEKFIKEDKELLLNPNIWKTLDVDYYPPRVERVWTQIGDYRYYLHIIHPTNELCLFHKHKWPSAIRILKGQYEMGVSYCEREVTSEEAYNLPIAAKFILSEGSSYEMTNTHGLHYVKPLGDVSYSIMVSGIPYSEKRQEAPFEKLSELDEATKLQNLSDFHRLLTLERIKLSI